MFLRQSAGFSAAQFSEIAPQELTMRFLPQMCCHVQFYRKAKSSVNKIWLLNPLFSCAGC